MLVNLVPEFLATLAAPDPSAAYHEYLDRHRPVLSAYWQNYVLDPESPHVESIIDAALRADRSDLTRLLEDVDVVAIAEDALRRALETLEADCPIDLYLMVGVGAANGGGGTAAIVAGLVETAVLSRFGNQKMPFFLATNSKEDLMVLKELIEAGKVRPVVERTYPLSETAAAIRYLEEGHARGKIVITV